MTDEQINVAIAKACGWTKINVQDRSGISPTNGLRMGSEFFPKYTKCLNAMHEAEKVLTDNDWDLYCTELGHSLRRCADATARERAEAFLRTLGKLEEVQE